MKTDKKPKRVLRSTKRQLLGVIAEEGTVMFLTRKRKSGHDKFELMESKDGFKLKALAGEVGFYTAERAKYDLSGLEEVRLSRQVEGYVATLVIKDKKKRKLVVAVSTDLWEWIVNDVGQEVTGPSVVVSDFSYRDYQVMYIEDTFVRLALSRDYQDWSISDRLLLTSRESFFDEGPITLLGADRTSHGLFMAYDASKVECGKVVLAVGGVLLSSQEPYRVWWRSNDPLFKGSLSKYKSVRSIGCCQLEGNLLCYWQVGECDYYAVSIPSPWLEAKELDKKYEASVKRYENNPVIEPIDVNDWESDGTFNPAVMMDEDKVHIVYRAVGRGGVSVFGYAVSEDGLEITERYNEPIYVPREDFEGLRGKLAGGKGWFESGGGWGGCEDPKLTKIGDRVYMTYVAYSGCGPPRAALTSLSLEDFKNQNWNWEEPILISPPDVVTKSACLLPEKINGKYVMFHRIFPDILVDYLDDLEFKGGKWLEGHDRIGIRVSHWDSRKLSMGATPIKTEDGWLCIYHAVDDCDPGRYKMGAMLLKKEDPAQVLCRTSQPLLAPDVSYENEGKQGVVYPSGAVVKGDDLLVYYGGGDRVVCVARTPLKKFLKDLRKEGEQVKIRVKQREV